MTGSRKPAPGAKIKMPVSDAAVQAKTGKSWAQWGTLLDRAKAQTMSHREIAELLHAKFGVGPWWTQMVTVGYERARGRRAANETAQGFRASVSRTLAASAAAVFRHWTDAKARDRWLPRQRFTVRTTIVSKSLRITWPDGTDVQVMITSRGPGKSVLEVTHANLSGAAAVRGARSFWSVRLDTLRELLES